MTSITTPAVLDVQHVAKSFPNKKTGPFPVIEDISMSVRSGDFVSIVGPSGAGKSTLFGLLAGLEAPTAGTIAVNGVPSHDSTAHAAYMPQKDLLFPWLDVLGNAAIGLEIGGMAKKDARRRAEDMLETFGLEGRGQARPFELSGGMRQRVALLRTVLLERPVMLLDEPFGALDYLTRTELQVWLSETSRELGWTVVLITHDVPEAVLLSDRVYVLSPRPASIATVIDIDLPRPRGIATFHEPDFAEYEQKLLTQLTSSSPRRRTSRATQH